MVPGFLVASFRHLCNFLAFAKAATWQHPRPPTFLRLALPDFLSPALTQPSAATVPKGTSEEQENTFVTVTDFQHSHVCPGESYSLMHKPYECPLLPCVLCVLSLPNAISLYRELAVFFPFDDR